MVETQVTASSGASSGAPVNDILLGDTMKKYLIAAVALTAIAAPASAEIGGGRVEAVIGWDNVNVDLGPGFGDLDEDGIVYGIGGGYDFALNETLALGVDAEATLSSTDIDFVDGTDAASVDAKRDLYIGGRITAAVSPAFNIYGKIGYTNARIRASITDAGVTTRDSANADGLRLGLGGQYNVSKSAYVGLEYRYSNYEADFTRNQVVGTVGFRF